MTIQEPVTMGRSKQPERQKTSQKKGKPLKVGSHDSGHSQKPVENMLVQAAHALGCKALKLHGQTVLTTIVHAGLSNPFNYFQQNLNTGLALSAIVTTVFFIIILIVWMDQ